MSGRQGGREREREKGEREKERGGGERRNERRELLSVIAKATKGVARQW
jgi:hypothetical protein